MIKPLKWCSGPCGRELPRTEFYRVGRFWAAACRRCDNIRRVDAFKRAYYRGPGSRLRYLSAQRARRRRLARIDSQVSA